MASRHRRCRLYIVVRHAAVAHALCLSSASPRSSSCPWERICDVQEPGVTLLRIIIDTDGTVAFWRFSGPPGLYKAVEHYVSSRVVRADFALDESSKAPSVSQFTGWSRRQSTSFRNDGIIIMLQQAQNVSSSPSSSLSSLSIPSRSSKVMNTGLASFSVMFSHLDLTSRSTSSSNTNVGGTSWHREALSSDLLLADGGWHC